MSMFPPLLAALAMAKEGEQKTILQVYVSSISVHEFLLGKIFAFMLIALAECVLGNILLLTYFGLNYAGDPTPFLVASIFYAFCVSAFGTFVGAAIPNQAAAIQGIALGGFVLVFLLAGLIFPVQNIPGWPPLDLRLRLGALLHRDRARRAAARRGLGGHVVARARARLHRLRLLLLRLVHHAAHAT